MPLKRTSGVAVSNFVRDNKIYRFRINKHLLYDKISLFINMHVHELLNAYGLDHLKSSPYYPKRNGQTKAMNKTLLCILNRMVYRSLRGRLTPTQSLYVPMIP